jgi:outer membrane protein TolC
MATPDPSATRAPIRAMTLPEALAYARVHQPAIQNALARVEAAAAEARVARAQWLPSLGATAQVFEGTANNSTAAYLGVPEVDLPRIGGTAVRSTGTFAPRTSTLAAVGAGQEVFDFGRIAAEAAVADVAREAARYRAESERLRVELMIKEAFFGVQGARAVQRAAEDAFARARVHRDMAAAGVKSGLHATVELTRAEADLTRFDVGRIRTAGGLATAQAVFAAAVGVEDPLLDAAGEAPTAAPPPPLGDGLAHALARDPALLGARAQIRGAEATARAIGAELRPDLSLSATFSARAGTATPTSGPLSPDTGPIPTVPNWDVGLVLRWPLAGSRWPGPTPPCSGVKRPPRSSRRTSASRSPGRRSPASNARWRRPTPTTPRRRPASRPGWARRSSSPTPRRCAPTPRSSWRWPSSTRSERAPSWAA